MFDWVCVEDKLPPNMVPVDVEIRDPLNPPLLLQSAMYSDYYQSWVREDFSGLGGHVPLLYLDRYAYRWRHR